MIETKSAAQTKKFARLLTQKIIKGDTARPVVLALQGNLGSGKTVFAQGLASALGIKGKVQSPTFVIMKIYRLGKRFGFKYLAHIDCYRLKSAKDLLRLGFKELVKDKDAIVVIEWAEKVKSILPKDSLWIKFAYGSEKGTRIIKGLCPKSGASSANRFW